MVDDPDEKRLEEAKRQLDALPPEFVEQVIRDRGLIDVALDVLKELAYGDDPEIRAQARAAIREYGLQPLLAQDDDWQA